MLSVKSTSSVIYVGAFHIIFFGEDEGGQVFSNINFYKFYNEHAVELISGGIEFYKP